MTTLSFVLKTVERCNINCSYCYFFNGVDVSYKKHPPYISQSTIDNFCTFLAQAVQSNQIKKVYISFHGGEPLMQNKNDFILMCSKLRNTLNTTPDVKLMFSIQTNGMLLNNEWLDILAKEKVNIGISMDGPQEFHDKFRIDKQGKGTFHRVVEKIKLTQKHPYYSNAGIGILCVIGPGFNALNTHKMITQEIGVSDVDYLIPDNNYAFPSNMKQGELGNVLVDLFNEWTKIDSEKINIRYFNSLLGHFFGYESSIYGVGNSGDHLPLITISSNGDLGPADELRSTDPALMQNNGNVENTSFNEFLLKRNIMTVKNETSRLPDDCQQCCWKKLCHGGGIVNRYSKSKIFNNKTYYCSELKYFYGKIVEYLLHNGYTSNQLLEALA